MARQSPSRGLSLGWGRKKSTVLVRSQKTFRPAAIKKTRRAGIHIVERKSERVELMRDSMPRAMNIWFRLNADERYAIRSGKFPAQPVKAAVAAGHDELKLCAALAEIARRNSGDPL